MGKKIVANLKMYLQIDDIKEYISKVNDLCFSNNEIIICPSFVHIPFFAGKNFSLGAQDVSIHDIGAYTGEVSSEQLREVGVKYSIVGHSECRKNFGDTNDIINKKIKNCFTSRINPIVCLGETKDDKILGRTEQVLRREILDTFQDLNREEMNNIIIVYEPIWSIGTGNIPSIKDIEKSIKFIKDLFYGAYKINVEVLYGGSVNSKNILELINIPNCDGFLIGGASSRINEFVKIINVLNET